MPNINGWYFDLCLHLYTINGFVVSVLYWLYTKKEKHMALILLLTAWVGVQYHSSNHIEATKVASDKEIEREISRDMAVLEDIGAIDKQ